MLSMSNYQVEGFSFCVVLVEHVPIFPSTCDYSVCDSGWLLRERNFMNRASLLQSPPGKNFFMPPPLEVFTFPFSFNNLLSSLTIVNNCNFGYPSEA